MSGGRQSTSRRSNMTEQRTDLEHLDPDGSDPKTTDLDRALGELSTDSSCSGSSNESQQVMTRDEESLTRKALEEDVITVKYLPLSACQVSLTSFLVFLDHEEREKLRAISRQSSVRASARATRARALVATRLGGQHFDAKYDRCSREGERVVWDH